MLSNILIILWYQEIITYLLDIKKLYNNSMISNNYIVIP